MNAVYTIYRGVSMFLQVIEIGLLIYCVLSWIVPPTNRIMATLSRIFDPILAPIRRVLFRIFPRLPIDLSVFVLFILISVVRNLLLRILLLFV